MLLKATKSTNPYTEGVIRLLVKHVPPIHTYTEGVISLLETYVHPQISSPHSKAVRGGCLVITTFLISDRHLRCCVLPNIHRRCHQLNRKVYAIYKPLPRTAKLCGEGWSSCYIHISIKRKTPSVLFSPNHRGLYELSIYKKDDWKSPLQIGCSSLHPYGFGCGKPHPYKQYWS